MSNSAAVRFGILGCSSVAQRRFLPALLKSARARLERTGSRTLTKATGVAQAFQCAKAGSYDELLDDPDVDAVYLSLPVALHEGWLRKAAQRKKHVLCEKPAFVTYQTALETVQFFRSCGVRLMEGYMCRYHPQHALVKQLVKQGRIGQPRAFTAEYAVPRPPANDIRFKPELGGGVFLDAAGYPPAAALMLLASKPVSVFCLKHTDSATGVDDMVAMLVEFANGEIGHFTAAYGLQYRAKYSLLGTQGRIEVERAFAINPEVPATVTLETDQGLEKFRVEPADQFLLMIEDFSELIGGKTAGPTDCEAELLHQHAYMDAARRSALEQRPVKLSEYSS